jgi:hypothetical protein
LGPRMWTGSQAIGEPERTAGGAFARAKQKPRASGGEERGGLPAVAQCAAARARFPVYYLTAGSVSAEGA